MEPSRVPAPAALVRAPLSYDDTSAAEEDDGRGAGSDADAFHTGGEEEFDSASDWSEYLELEQEVPMPKARVSGDDDDFEDFAAEGAVDEGGAAGVGGAGLGMENAGVLVFGSGLEGLEDEDSDARGEENDAPGEVGVEDDGDEGSTPGGARPITATFDIADDDDEELPGREGDGDYPKTVEESRDDASDGVVDVIGNGCIEGFASTEKETFLAGLKDTSVVRDEEGDEGSDGIMHEEEVIPPDGTESTVASVGAVDADDAVVMDRGEAGLSSNASEEPEHDALKQELVFTGKGGHSFVDFEEEPCSVEVGAKMDGTPSEQKIVVTGTTRGMETPEQNHNVGGLTEGGNLIDKCASVEYENDQETAAEIGATNGSMGVHDRVLLELETGNEATVSETDKPWAVPEVNSVETVCNLIPDNHGWASAEQLQIHAENSKKSRAGKTDDWNKENMDEAGDQVNLDSNSVVLNNSLVFDDRVPVKLGSEKKELSAASQQDSPVFETDQSMLPAGLAPDIGGLDTGDFEDFHDREDVSDESVVIDLNEVIEKEEEEESLISEESERNAIFESFDSAKELLEHLNGSASSSNSNADYFQDFPSQMDIQVVTESDEDVITEGEGDGKELLDSADLTAFIKAATGTSPGRNARPTGSDVARIFSVERPAGLGSSEASRKPLLSHPTRSNLFPPNGVVAGDDESTMDEEEKKLHEKFDQVRVKFLRLLHRLGCTPEDTVAAQVIYRLGLAEGIKHGRPMGHAFSVESAKQKALKFEADLKDDIGFSCSILVLGKTGAGKSATINSIFGDKMIRTNAFQPETTRIKEVVGIVNGVAIRLIDTPGLSPFAMDQSSNGKILLSIKKHMKKCAPDVILYVDRLDALTRDLSDLPLLRSIKSALGSSIWSNTIVALTHSATAPPDGPSGAPLNYDAFVAQRSHVVQHSIRQATGDMRLMNPVALVENHSSCRRNKEGQKVLPNGIGWRSQLLLLCYSSKILSEANSLTKFKEKTPRKVFGFHFRSPSLPYLLSLFLRSSAHPKLPSDHSGENIDSDLELEDFLDSDQEQDDDYERLPPFKPLKKAQIAKLTKEQRKAYFDEYDYRVNLLQKNQLKDELKRVKEMQKRGKDTRDEFYNSEITDDYAQDAAPAAVPVPLADMVLPLTFDSQNPAYRYRCTEPTSQLLMRPVLVTHGWDHDCGYDGVNLEENLAVAGLFPASAAVQITKDKKDFSINLESSIAAKHGENRSSLASFDIQPVGKQQLAYILRGETKFKNLKKNKTSAGVSVTILGENVATGLKLEDRLSIGKRVNIAASTGIVRYQGDVACGANLEAQLHDKDYPIGQDNTTLGLSLVKWRDLAVGANLQSQFSVGRHSKMAVGVGLNNKLSGQITVRTNSSDNFQIALLGVLTMLSSIFWSVWPGESYLD